MDIVKHIQEVMDRVKHDYPDAKCTVRHWADFEEGCWIDFELPKFPFIVLEIENGKEGLLYSAHSVWHGTEYGGSRFGSPKQYSSVEDMLVRLQHMVNQYVKAAGGIQLTLL